MCDTEAAVLTMTPDEWIRFLTKMFPRVYGMGYLFRSWHLLVSIQRHLFRFKASRSRRTGRVHSVHLCIFYFAVKVRFFRSWR